MLAETVAEAASRFGERAALVAEAGWKVSFADLDRYSDEVAVGLARRGISSGDVVGLLLPAGPEHFVAYAAIAKLGAITAAVNPRLTAGERTAVFGAAGPSAVITTPTLGEGGGVTSSDGIEVIVVIPAERPDALFAGVRVEGEVPDALSSDPDRPVAIVFTSGTTGTPKGAVFCGRQLEFITATDVGTEWGGGGNVIAGSALSHLGPMTKFPGNLRRGSTQHLTGAWRAADALRRIAELRVAAIGGVPTQLALMLRDPDFDRHDLSSVRAIVIGGGPATPALIREARARFGVPLAVRYSCTEAGTGTGTGLADPDEDAEVSVGRPQPGVAVRILDGDGHEVSAGGVGEVVLSSPTVMSGYWRDEDGSAAARGPGGGVRTGDLGWIDEAGRLRLAGRSRERYVRGGYNVHPMEVEAVLADHPDISAIAIVGRVDAVMGEVGVAVVVARRGRPVPDLAAVRHLGDGRLATYKLPDDLLVLDALPLTSMDKVDRRALEALVARDSDRL